MLQKRWLGKRSAVAVKRRVGTAGYSSSTVSSAGATPLSRRPDRHGGYSRLLRRLRSVGAANAANSVISGGGGGGDGYFCGHARDTQPKSVRGNGKARDSGHGDIKVAAVRDGRGIGRGDCGCGGDVDVLSDSASSLSNRNGNGGSRDGTGGGRVRNAVARAVDNIFLRFPAWLASGFSPRSRTPVPNKEGHNTSNRNDCKPQGSTGGGEGCKSSGDANERGRSSDNTVRREKSGSTDAAANTPPASAEAVATTTATMEGLMFVLGRALGTLVRVVVRVTTGRNVAFAVGADAPPASPRSPPGGPAEAAATSAPMPAPTLVTAANKSVSPPAPVTAAAGAFSSAADAVPSPSAAAERAHRSRLLSGGGLLTATSGTDDTEPVERDRKSGGRGSLSDPEGCGHAAGAGCLSDAEPRPRPPSEKSSSTEVALHGRVDAGDSKEKALGGVGGANVERGGAGPTQSQRGAEGIEGGGEVPRTWKSVINDLAHNPKNRCDLPR